MTATDLNNFVRRSWRSAVVWSWIFNGLRLSGVLILLPLITRFLSVPDMGFYMILQNLVTLVPLLDMGFLPAIGRSISYAMAGAKELKAHGTDSSTEAGGQPNFALLWQLLSTTRTLYQFSPSLFSSESVPGEHSPSVSRFTKPPIQIPHGSLGG